MRVNPSVGKNYAYRPSAVVSAHSVLWPGAVAVARKRQVVNVYIGNGQKFLPNPYTPPQPPSVQTEFVAAFNPDEGEEDPLVEQTDPIPDKNTAAALVGGADGDGDGKDPAAAAAGADGDRGADSGDDDDPPADQDSKAENDPDD